MIEAAIFDMDGLLIDSEPLWRAAHMSALRDYDITITEDDVRQMAGRRTDEVIEHWRKEHDLGHIENSTLEASVVNKVIASIHLNGVELPGVKQVISMFEQRNIPMAVASSSAPEIIDVVLEKLDLKKYMQLAHSAKYEEYGKPHPAVFLTTARKLGVSAAQCVVFEDSLSGVRAAKAAGMLCVAVPEQHNIDNPKFREEADIVVPNLSEIDWPTIRGLSVSS
jgi:HAD superfamily hydrolase (TIGR01509 family)